MLMIVSLQECAVSCEITDNHISGMFVEGAPAGNEPNLYRCRRIAPASILHFLQFASTTSTPCMGYENVPLYFNYNFRVS